MQKASKNNKFASSVKVGPKGQIVIPKEVREMFGISPGDTLILFADKKRGIAINNYDVLGKIFEKIILGSQSVDDEDGVDENNEIDIQKEVKK